MQTYETLMHATWDCIYHVVFIPKYRRMALYAQLRRDLGPVFRDLAEQKECKVEEGHLIPDHVNMMLWVPPKYSVSSVMGFIKGKRAIHIACVYAGRRRNFVGQHLSGSRYLKPPAARHHLCARALRLHSSWNGNEVLLPARISR
jgi:putative transposase